jgi:hypothetical protein
MLHTKTLRLLDWGMQTWCTYMLVYGAHVHCRRNMQMLAHSLLLWREFTAMSVHVKATHVRRYVDVVSHTFGHWRQYASHQKLAARAVGASHRLACAHTSLSRWTAYTQLRLHKQHKERVCACITRTKLSSATRRGFLAWSQVLMRRRLVLSGCCYDPMPVWAFRMQLRSSLSNPRNGRLHPKRGVFSPLRHWSVGLRRDRNGQPDAGNAFGENALDYADEHIRHVSHVHVHAHPSRVRRLCVRALLGSGVAGGGDKARLMVVFACWASCAYVCSCAKSILRVTLP